MVPSLAEATIGRKKRCEAMEGVVIKIDTGSSMQKGGKNWTPKARRV